MENQTFFTKSKILEKAVSQAQNDEFIFCRWITAFCLNRPCGKPDIFHKIKDFGKSSQSSSE